MAKAQEKRWCFLDRDGVVVEDIRPWKTGNMVILPGVVLGLRRLENLGFQFIITTNQAGIAKNYYTERDAKRFNNELIRQLAEEKIVIKKIYICPHYPDITGDCNCRKPKIGLAERAAKDFGIDLKESYFVGDKDSDTEFGKNCGGKTFRIKSEYPKTVKADYEASDLIGVAEILENALD